MGKHKLILMRHAKSDWSTAGTGDFDRPLANRGRKDAPRMGRWLSKHAFKPDKFISSPAQRAKETAIFVADAIDFPHKDIIWDERVYDGSLQDLLEVIKNHCADTSTLLLIGHNPGLDSLLEYLSGDTLTLSETGKLMTTAAVAVLDYGREVINAKASGARLKELIRPREISS
jgi:phosphohistidine phosphatase